MQRESQNRKLNSLKEGKYTLIKSSLFIKLQLYRYEIINVFLFKNQKASRNWL